MAISLRGTAVTAPGYTASLVLDLPAGVQAGDVLLAHIACRLPNSQTLTAPAGWTLIGGAGGNASSGIGQWAYYHVAGSSEPASYTFTWSAQPTGENGGAMSAWIGVDNSNPVDASAISGQVDSTSITAPSISPTGSSDLLVCLYAHENSSTNTQTLPANLTSGYSEDTGGYSPGFLLGYRQLSASGATGTQVATLATADYNTGTSIAFAPASGASTQTITPAALNDESIGAASASGVASAIPGALADESIGAPSTKSESSAYPAALADESIASPDASGTASAFTPVFADEAIAAPVVRAIARAVASAIEDEMIAAPNLISGAISITLLPIRDESLAAPGSTARSSAIVVTLTNGASVAPVANAIARLNPAALCDESAGSVTIYVAGGGIVVAITLGAAPALDIALSAAPALNISLSAAPPLNITLGAEVG